MGHKVEPLTEAEKDAYREALVKLAVDAYGVASMASGLWGLAKEQAGGLVLVKPGARDAGQALLARIAERGRGAECARAAALSLLIMLRDAPEDIPPDDAREKTAMVEEWWAKRIELACGTALKGKGAGEGHAEAQGRGEGREDGKQG